MIIVNTPTLADKQIVLHLGVVRGSTVRSRNVGKDILAFLKTLVGGEIEEYTQLLADSREQAIARMVDDARKLGADAVVNVRFMTSAVSSNMAEMLAYGTAVKLKDL